MIGALFAVVLSSSVISVPKGDLYDEDPVVTNVDLSGIGEARSLPKYLHEKWFDDAYPEAAEAYYRSRGNGKANGGCSSTYGGGFLSRNFDYPFDDRAEFVVRMSAGAGRFASVGVAQVGTNLTERFVTSGEPSWWYKALPGATVDGINERGVACNINVSDDEPSWGTGPVDRPLHPLAVIRWTLDHATNAQSAALYIAEHVRFPQGWVQNFHYMVADAERAYVVENGEALPAEEYHEPDEPATMTNFPLNRFPWNGMGMERFGLLLGGANITNAWYTRAYRRETVPQWKSEFSADVLERTNDIFNAWAEHPREYFRGRSGDNGDPWWQTVHTSVYDLTNRTLRIAVQETDDWYVFAVPSGGKVTSVNGETGDVEVTPEKIGALSSESDPAFRDWAAAATNAEGAVTNAVASRVEDGVFRMTSDGRTYVLVRTPGEYVVEILSNGYNKSYSPDFAGKMAERSPSHSWLDAEYRLDVPRYPDYFSLRHDPRPGAASSWELVGGNTGVGYLPPGSGPALGFEGTMTLNASAVVHGPSVIRAYRVPDTYSWVETNVYDRIVSGSAEGTAFSNAVMRAAGGGMVLEESDPVLAEFKTSVWNDVSAYSGNTNMTQRQKTELLLKIVERFKPEGD